MDLDDYVSYSPGYIVNENLVKQIEELDFNNREDVLNIIDRIENSVNWKKVQFELNVLENRNINKIKEKECVR